MIREKLESEIKNALKKLDLGSVGFSLEDSPGLSHGDLSANVAMVLEGDSRNLAEKIVGELEKAQLPEIQKIEIAGRGFINFYLSSDFFSENLKDVLKEKNKYGSGKALKEKKVIVEYTDPNPFKKFHIGHLMSNTIGESLSRLVEFSGAKVRRANYQGDVGVHVAKALWGKMHNPSISWGEAYVIGAGEYEKSKGEIDALNKKIYDRSDGSVNKLYNKGKKTTLEEFEEMYEKLGTKFDYYFFESEAGELGKKIVEEKTGDVFEKSEGAVVFRGEEYKLHTRVFVNSEGLPTYEAKELGLAKLKYAKYKHDLSVVVTANEVDEYFKVLLKAMEFVYPDLAKKTKHVSHGVMKLPGGKISSRTGDVVTAESVIQEVKGRVLERMEQPDEDIATKVAISALKYSILRQGIGRDVVFDLEKHTSFEGDSGPYLQYTYVRAKSVVEKARGEKIKASTSNTPDSLPDVVRLLHRFPHVAERATELYAPQLVTTYLTELAGSFNSFYAREKITDRGDKHSPYKVALTQAVATVLKNGMWLLGIEIPERM